MKKISEVLLTAILTFITGFTINSIINYIFRAEGSVTIGDVIVLADKYYLPFDISNFEDKEISDLRLVMPASIQVSDISSTNPILIKKLDTTSNGATQTISISGIEAYRTTRIILPVQSLSTKIEIPNLMEKHLTIVPTIQIESQLTKAIKSGLLSTIISVFVYSIGLWIFVTLNYRLNAQALELRKDVEKLREESELQYSRASKMKILMLARLSDYSKELDFWRDTIRKIVYSQSDKVTAEQTIRTVTDSLKTYGTLDRQGPDLKTIEIYASLMEGPSKVIAK